MAIQTTTGCETGFGRIKYMSRRKSKALLLDMDGVILNHHKANALIREKCEKYIEYTLDMSREEARMVNSYLYDKYGHTAIGVQKMFKKNITIDEFSRFVYDSMTMLQIQHMTPSDTTYETGKKINALVEVCFDNGIPVYVFSNAPMVWCQWGCWITRLNHKISPLNMITCDHGNGGLLKPNPAIYEYVHQMLQFDELLFVDDSIKNMTTNPYWTCFHLDPNPTKKINYDSHVIPIKDVSEVMSFI